MKIINLAGSIYKQIQEQFISGSLGIGKRIYRIIINDICLIKGKTMKSEIYRDYLILNALEYPNMPLELIKTIQVTQSVAEPYKCNAITLQGLNMRNPQIIHECFKFMQIPK